MKNIIYTNPRISLSGLRIPRSIYPVLCGLFLLLGFQESQAQMKSTMPFYTGIDGNKILAVTSGNEVFVTFKNKVNQELAQGIARDRSFLSFEGEFSLFDPMNGLRFTYTGPASKLEDELQALRNLPGVTAAYPGYRVDGDELYVHSDMLIKPAIAKSSLILRNQLIARGFDVKKVFDMGREEEIWLVQIPADQNIWAVSQEFQEHGDVVFALPDFIGTGSHDLIPNDPSFGSQWFLSQGNDADIDAPEAWDITIGSSNVTVAVIDGDGYDLAHPELAGKTVSPYDAVNNDNNPEPGNANANHGTPCAGLIAAATNNSVGVASVGFNVRVKPVVIGFNATPTGGFSSSSAIVIAAINNIIGTANVVAVSNSYGLGNTLASNAAVITAYGNMQSNSRGGLGAVVLASTGNSGVANAGTFIGFPSSLASTVAVGSSTNVDNRTGSSDYGSFGNGIDVVAPGVQLPTIDRQGANGYTNSDYVNFSGTSAACPVAAGVVGLVASVDPSLTEAELESILNSTCDKVNPGTYTYSNTVGKNDGTWNDEMGYGRVNAFNAVRAVCPANAGTLNSASPTLLCFDDQGTDIFNVITNYDYSWTGAPEAGVAYLLYDQDPTGLRPGLDNPVTSFPGFIDILGSAPSGNCIQGGTVPGPSGSFENVLGGNQRYWVVPLALYDECPIGRFRPIGVDCQDAGYDRALSFVALDPISVDSDVDCGAAQGTFDVTFSNFDGGVPGFNNGSNYSVSGDGPGGLVGHNGQYVVAGVGGNTMVNITVTDGNGCSESFSYTTPPSYNPMINGLADDYCDNDPPVVFTGTPVLGTSFFGGPGVTEGTPNDGIATFDPSAANIGNNQITYTIVDALGCVYVATKNVNVIQRPIAGNNSIIICDDDTVNYDLQNHVNVFGNGVISTFEWRAISATPGVSGQSTTWQSGPIIDDVLDNSTVINQEVVYEVIPSSNTVPPCTGPPFEVRVTVRPSSKIQSLPAHMCLGGQVDLASLVRDYSFLAIRFDFYDGDPNAGGQFIATSRAVLGTVPMGTRVMVSPPASQVYYVVGTTIFGCTETVAFPVTVFGNCAVFPSVIAKLEGAYDVSSGNMRTTLNAGNLIPATEPYTGLGYTFIGGGGETLSPAAQQNPDVVDWVVIELRDQHNPAIVVASRAALLLKDGRIMDTDGVNPVQVNVNSTVPYHLAVIHRNHLGVMTANAIQPGTQVDFSDPNLAIFGTGISRSVNNGTALLIAGDADGNGQVQNTDDVLIWMPQAGQSGYQSADYNLDGQIQNTDRILIWNRNVGRGTAVPK